MADSAVGTTLSVVLGEPATYDSTGFAALSYTEVGEVSEIGEFGGSSEVLTFTPIKTGVIQKAIGPTNYGTIGLQYARNASDAGVIILKAGFDGANRDAEHSFKVTYPDTSVEYFTGKIASHTSNVGGASNILMGASNVELTNKVIQA